MSLEFDTQKHDDNATEKGSREHMRNNALTTEHLDALDSFDARDIALESYARLARVRSLVNEFEDDQAACVGGLLRDPVSDRCNRNGDLNIHALWYS